jgi:hypothetical protein
MKIEKFGRLLKRKKVTVSIRPIVASVPKAPMHKFKN